MFALYDLLFDFMYWCLLCVMFALCEFLFGLRSAPGFVFCLLCFSLTVYFCFSLGFVEGRGYSVWKFLFSFHGGGCCLRQVFFVVAFYGRSRRGFPHAN